LLTCRNTNSVFLRCGRLVDTKRRIGDRGSRSGGDRPYIPRRSLRRARVSSEVERDDQVVLDLPEVEPNTTGHIMSLSRFEQVYDVDARPLGSVPRPARIQVATVALDELARTPGICRSGEGFRSPRAALADLYSWTFGNAIPMRFGKWIFRGSNQIERRGGEHWQLSIDDADLRARVPNLRRHCWRVTAVTDGSRDLLKSLRVAEDSITFDLRWTEATSARVIIGSTRGADSWDLQRIRRAITVAGLFSEPLAEPFYVTVVLRKGNRMISGQHSWYPTPSSGRPMD
jgi:hypothetical protein